MPAATNVVSAQEVEDDRGQQIRFTGGKYGGRNGWLRLSKELRGDHQVHVLVALGDKVKKTYVDVSNVTELPGPPATWTDAMLQQHSDVESALENLCRKLSKFRLDNAAVKQELIGKIASRLEKAIDRQNTLGNRANFKRVNYNNGMDE
jgi:hypothetical protein